MFVYFTIFSFEDSNRISHPPDVQLIHVSALSTEKWTSTTIGWREWRSIEIAVDDDEVVICSIFSIFYSVWYFTPRLVVLYFYFLHEKSSSCMCSWYNLRILHRLYLTISPYGISIRKNIPYIPQKVDRLSSSEYQNSKIALPLVANHTTNVIDSKNACNNRAQFLAFDIEQNERRWRTSERRNTWGNNLKPQNRLLLERMAQVQFRRQVHVHADKNLKFLDYEWNWDFMVHEKPQNVDQISWNSTKSSIDFIHQQTCDLLSSETLQPHPMKLIYFYSTFLSIFHRVRRVAAT